MIYNYIIVNTFPIWFSFSQSGYLRDSIISQHQSIIIYIDLQLEFRAHIAMKREGHR